MRMRRDVPVILHATVVLMWSSMAGAVWMHLPGTGTKCVSEEIQANVVVLADYTAAYEDDEYESTATVSCKVTSPYGTALHHEENVTKGHFAFTTTESGSYLACFTLNLLYLKNREAEMRKVSEKTNNRISVFSFMSLGICIVVSALQLLHLKTFFERKKLI